MTLPDLLYQRACDRPDKIAYRFFAKPGVHQAITFRELWIQAVEMAHQLNSRGLQGKRILLVCESTNSFVITFWGCLLGRVLAVPASPPRHKQFTDRLEHIASDAGVSAVLSDCEKTLDCNLNAPLKIDLRDFRRDSEHDPVVCPSGVELNGQCLAFLQYTSGSTGNSKGVVLNHTNLVCNAQAIETAFDLDRDSVILTALPLFHDMGLVGGVLQSVYSGCEANFLPPGQFARCPEDWLRLMSNLRATISPGPNFMYDHTARTVTDDQIRGIDLSSWRVAVCGAEPIRPSTIDRFYKRFSAYGFEPSAISPCYGMAESTLLVTASSITSPPKTHVSDDGEFVSCGTPAEGVSIEIVDPDTGFRRADEETGEIWVRAPGVAMGYWADPELTAATFDARLTDGESTRYLRTGDLGYIRGNELYVRGRLKDLIIIYGINHPPESLEATAETCHEALRPSSGAAFSVNDYESCMRVVVAIELKRAWVRKTEAWRDIRESVCTAILHAHGISVDEVILLKPGGLPRTSSGKVRRGRCRTGYLSGELNRVDKRDRAPAHDDV